MKVGRNEAILQLRLLLGRDTIEELREGVTMNEMDKIVRGIIEATIEEVRDRLAANGRADIAALLRTPIDLEDVDRAMAECPLTRSSEATS